MIISSAYMYIKTLVLLFTFKSFDYQVRVLNQGRKKKKKKEERGFVHREMDNMHKYINTKGKSCLIDRKQTEITHM